MLIEVDSGNQWRNSIQLLAIYYENGEQLRLFVWLTWPQSRSELTTKCLSQNSVTINTTETHMICLEENESEFLKS